MNLAERLGLEHPVVQAGMGGGIATAKLAGAVSAAGALGTVGHLPPPLLREELRTARELAGGAPVAANLLVPFATRRHVEACAEGDAAMVVLHAGLDEDLISALTARGRVVFQTVGTSEEAAEALASGAAGVVAQGNEAGGHLVAADPAARALESVLGAAGGHPVLLAGGIATGEDVAQAMDAGAAAAVAGTRFLLTDEAAAHPLYKRRVLEAERTLVTILFSVGWPLRHRVVANPATDRWSGGSEGGPRFASVIGSLTRPLSRAPIGAIQAMTRAQRPAIPLYGPGAPLAGMPDRVVDAAALYAGETSLRIDSVVPARDAVRLLVTTPSKGNAR